VSEDALVDPAMQDGSAVVRTRRLTLVPMSAALMAAVLAKAWPITRRLLGSDFPQEWRADGWPWLSSCLAEADRDPGWTAWGPRLLLLHEDESRPVVGEVGFHGRPDPDGVAEFGYTIVLARRRQGFAEEAVRGLLSWADTHPELRRSRATIDPANAASLALIRKLGFVEVGRRRHPERGEELVFEREASGPR
jgi:RimJ/RimL family protein N-acetyltransferase